MAKAARKNSAALPSKAPKRTGKRGIGPKPDPVEVEAPKKPRQARLPQMEDPAIEELESAAEEYANIRDRRMALTTDEVACKEELLALMEKHEKTHYRHAGVEVDVVVESKKVKVRIKKDE